MLLMLTIASTAMAAAIIAAAIGGEKIMIPAKVK
jgi:hypothetical protein